MSVSYTHLDVYKRQAQRIGGTDSVDEYGTTEIDASQYRGSSNEGGD